MDSYLPLREPRSWQVYTVPIQFPSRTCARFHITTFWAHLTSDISQVQKPNSPCLLREKEKHRLRKMSWREALKNRVDFQESQRGSFFFFFLDLRLHSMKRQRETECQLSGLGSTVGQNHYTTKGQWAVCCSFWDLRGQIRDPASDVWVDSYAGGHPEGLPRQRGRARRDVLILSTIHV